MVLDKEKLINRIKEFVGENDDDNTISFLEDVNDSIDEFTKKPAEDWKKKYEENDANWRKKYKDRFFKQVDEDEEEFEEDKKKPLTFEALFTKE